MLAKEEIAMPVQCPKCKALNRDTSSFCSYCGSRLIVPPEQVTPDAAIQKPETIPEDQEKSTTAIREPEMMPEGPPPSLSPHVRPPRVKPGASPRSRIWYWYLAFVLSVAFIFFIIISSGEGSTSGLEAGVFFGIIASILGFPVALWSTRYSSIGIVTNLREWQPQGQPPPKKTPPSWVFNLQRTNQDWEPLEGSRGFLLPIVEVEFRSDRLHGFPLEEGSRVVVRGRWKRGRVHAKEIWNLSSGMTMPVRGEQQAFFGRVTGWASRQAQDLRYPGQRFLEVWSFRLQRTDKEFQQLLRNAQGNLLPALPVEIRARTISGPLQDGDKVEIRGQMIGGTLYTREIYNHSAGGAPLVVKEWAGAP